MRSGAGRGGTQMGSREGEGAGRRYCRRKRAKRATDADRGSGELHSLVIPKISDFRATATAPTPPGRGFEVFVVYPQSVIYK